MASENENLERLKELLSDEKYDEAIVLVRTIKERHAKSASDVLALARVYGKMHDFKRSENLFKKAYRLRPSKLMYHEVMDMCLENGHVKDAEEYLTEYRALSNYDEESALVYEYKILRAKGAKKEELIDALLRICDVSYTEDMAYELAKLYYRNGQIEECLRECEKITKYFYMSPVVKRATLLMAYCKGDVTADEIKNLGKGALDTDQNAEDSDAGQTASADPEAESTDENSYESTDENAYESTDENAYESTDENAYETMDDISDYADEIMESDKVNGIKDSAEAVFDIMDEEEQAAMNELIHNIANKCMKNGKKDEKKHKKGFFAKMFFGDGEPEKEYATYANYVMPGNEPAEFLSETNNEDFLGQIKPGQSDILEESLAETVTEQEKTKQPETKLPETEQPHIPEQGSEQAEFTKKESEEKINEQGYSEATDDEAYEKLMREAMLQMSADIDSSLTDPLNYYVPYAEQFTYEYRNEKLCRIMKHRNVDVHEICKNFYRIPDTRKLIFQALDMAINYRGTMCLVVTGEKKSGRSTLAVRLVNLYCKMGILKSGKVAKISADVLNRIDLKKQEDVLYDCNILIEDAGSVDIELLNSIIDYYDQKHNGTGIILEDETKDINRLFRANDEYTKRFNSRIHLPKYKTSDLLGFMYDIFAENDYKLDTDAAGVLTGIIEERPKNTHALVWACEKAGCIVSNADKRLSGDLVNMAKNASYENYKLVITGEDII